VKRQHSLQGLAHWKLLHVLLGIFIAVFFFNVPHLGEKIIGLHPSDGGRAGLGFNAVLPSPHGLLLVGVLAISPERREAAWLRCSTITFKNIAQLGAPWGRQIKVAAIGLRHASSSLPKLVAKPVHRGSEPLH